MMYGFGDDVSPLPETLDLVEDIVLDYAGTLMRKVRRSTETKNLIGTAGHMLWGSRACFGTAAAPG